MIDHNAHSTMQLWPVRLPDRSASWYRASLLRGDSLDGAIAATIAYFDVFAFAATAAEIHRFVLGYSASRAEVEDRLRSSPALAVALGRRDGLYFLAGKAHLAERRMRFAGKTQRMWKMARRIADTIERTGLATCGMVTGSLAAENVDESADIDFLFTYPSGRTYSSFAAVRLLAKVPRLGLELMCPNYALPEDRLEINPKNLFTAWEIAKAVPMFGADVYREFVRANAWVQRFLPNALPRIGGERVEPPAPRLRGGAERVVEAVSALPGFGKLEAYERKRKRGTDTRDVGVDMKLREAQGSSDRHSPTRSFHALSELRYRMVRLGIEAHPLFPEIEGVTAKLEAEMRRWGDAPIRRVDRTGGTRDPRANGHANGATGAGANGESGIDEGAGGGSANGGAGSCDGANGTVGNSTAASVRVAERSASVLEAAGGGSGNGTVGNGIAASVRVAEPRASVLDAAGVDLPLSRLGPTAI